MKVQVIIGSSHPGRVSDRVANWAVSALQALPEAPDVEIVDIATFDLPFFDEAISPQYNPQRQSNPAAQKWLDKVAEADAYLIITPEYNRSLPAVLKNALDYVDFQFAKKPVALVGHGSTGGAQSVAHMRGVLAGLKSFATPSVTMFVGRAGDMFNESGELLDEALRTNPYGPQAALQGTVAELQWYGQALADARAQAA